MIFSYTVGQKHSWTKAQLDRGIAGQRLTCGLSWGIDKAAALLSERRWVGPDLVGLHVGSELTGNFSQSFTSLQ